MDALQPLEGLRREIEGRLGIAAELPGRGEQQRGVARYRVILAAQRDGRGTAASATASSSAARELRLSL